MDDQAVWFFDPILSVPLICGIGLVMLVLTLRIYWLVGRSIRIEANLFLMLLRISGIALLLALLLRPSERTTSTPPKTDFTTLIGLDTSLSMKQRDVNDKSRFDAAKELLQQANVIDQEGMVPDYKLRLFGFADDARSITSSILGLVADGKTTSIATSIHTMLVQSGDEKVNGIILVTDGHDFEMVNPVKTGLEARAAGVPIYAVPMGQYGTVRDVSVRITGFQPYCYVKQKFHINATLRLIGCELEDLTVELLRQGKVIQTKQVNAEELEELPVEFEVSEEEIGQYNYEVRVQPLQNEVDITNNAAVTFLNVIDQQLRVLLLEGDPYWDSGFLERSLMRDDKINLDSITRYGGERVRAIRKFPQADGLEIPTTLDQLAVYDVVIVGRNLDTLSGPNSTGPSLPDLLDQYIKDRSGTVIFSRGNPFSTATDSDMTPLVWSDQKLENVHLTPTAEGRNIGVFENLNVESGGLDKLPELIEASMAQPAKPLTSVLATVTSRDGGGTSPAILYRRYGSGQVLSIGVTGLWKWAFAQNPDSPYDRFWDQIVLWLLRGREQIPTRDFSAELNSANILLGDKIYFSLAVSKTDPHLTSLPIVIYSGNKEVARVSLAPSTNSHRFTADYLPEHTGNYRAVFQLPNGKEQERLFVVFSQNLEETEVATDALYLRHLCDASGGRLLEPGELPQLLKDLNDQKTDQSPIIETKPVWNEAWVFYLTGLFFGLDWFFRRRWGLC